MNCALTNEDGTCVACLNGILPVDGTCNSDKTCGDGCEVCMNELGCFYCKEGYVLTNKEESVKSNSTEEDEDDKKVSKEICIPETEKLKNCSFGSKNDRCKICKYNFYLKTQNAAEIGECLSQNIYTLDVFPKRELNI